MEPDSIEQFWPSGAVTAVNPDDLRRAWEFHKTQGGHDRAAGFALFKEACHLGEDANAVVYRLTILQFIERGVLPGVQQEGKLDDAVFRVLATFPMIAMEVGKIYSGMPFDVEEFRRQIENARGQ